MTHINPMIRANTNNWRDSQTGEVMVDHVRFQNGSERWRVLKKETFKSRSWFVAISSHITPEMAVIMAQRLANRLLREKKR